MNGDLPSLSGQLLACTPKADQKQARCVGRNAHRRRAVEHLPPLATLSEDMMRASPYLCSCGRTVPSGQRCPCKPPRPDDRPSAARRGYDRQFREAARAFLMDHPRCTCGAPAVLVMHKVSIRWRPDLRMDQSNWLPGCRSCNAKHAHDDKREGGVRASAEWTGDRTPPTAQNTPVFVPLSFEPEENP